jgi:energy-converting hydrogenase Eha subunit G
VSLVGALVAVAAVATAVVHALLAVGAPALVSGLADLAVAAEVVLVRLGKARLAHVGVGWWGGVA